jgi:hypothetical protein
MATGLKAYHIVVVSVAKDAKPQAGVMSAVQVTEHLNTLAAQGWKVISSAPMGFDAEAVRLYFLMEKDVV